MGLFLRPKPEKHTGFILWSFWHNKHYSPTGFVHRICIYGGLSELPESEYISCSMGSTIAGEIGVFGYRPSVMLEMIAGKRAEIGTELGAYMRTFYGDCSPTDLETALQV